jgi:hypothetical protein
MKVGESKFARGQAGHWRLLLDRTSDGINLHLCILVRFVFLR